MFSNEASTYHISGSSVFIPSQLYTFKTASQNLPHDGIPTAPPIFTKTITAQEKAFIRNKEQKAALICRRQILYCQNIFFTICKY